MKFIKKYMFYISISFMIISLGLFLKFIHGTIIVDKINLRQVDSLYPNLILNNINYITQKQNWDLKKSTNSTSYDSILIFNKLSIDAKNWKQKHENLDVKISIRKLVNDNKINEAWLNEIYLTLKDTKRQLNENTANYHEILIDIIYDRYILFTIIAIIYVLAIILVIINHKSNIKRLKEQDNELKRLNKILNIQ